MCGNSARNQILAGRTNKSPPPSILPADPCDLGVTSSQDMSPLLVLIFPFVEYIVHGRKIFTVGTLTYNFFKCQSSGDFPIRDRMGAHCGEF